MNILAKLKESKKQAKKLALEDVNRPLFTALFGISVYGKSARDDEIMELIVGQRTDPMVQIRENFRAKQKAEGSTWKKEKDGTIRNERGFLVLQPKM